MPRKSKNLNDKWVANHQPDPEPPIPCQNCKCVRKHISIGTGKIFRKDVLFRDEDSNGKELMVPVSGPQTVELFKCSVCGTVRQFGCDPGKKCTDLYLANYGGRTKGYIAA